jgi:hypothetical protein
MKFQYFRITGIVHHAEHQLRPDFLRPRLDAPRKPRQADRVGRIPRGDARRYRPAGCPPPCSSRLMILVFLRALRG